MPFNTTEWLPIAELSSMASDYRLRAEEQFKVKTKSNSKAVTFASDARDDEVAKTARLRALRLAKEAADKDFAEREAAAKANRVKRRTGTNAARVP